jgi:hypothetical protein
MPDGARGTNPCPVIWQQSDLGLDSFVPKDQQGRVVLGVPGFGCRSKVVGLASASRSGLSRDNETICTFGI